MTTSNGPTEFTPEAYSLERALSYARETRRLEIGSGANQRVARVFRDLFGDRPAVIVADTNTHPLAGEAVAQALADNAQPLAQPFIYDADGLYAESAYVEQLEKSLKQHQAIPIAVGSGTLNDLVKLASHRTDRRYMCVATAASMDGYTAFGASITHQGSKQTFFCPAPLGVVADLDVIAGAPAPMTASGYADLLAKVTAGADWILADALGVEAIHPEAWNIVQGRLREMVSDPAGVSTGRQDSISRLVEGLMLGGFAMQAMKSSRAASGAEHQFSHLWDMQHHTYNGSAPSHGFKVGIGTLAVTALYEALFRKPLQDLDVAAACARWPAEPVWRERILTAFGTGELTTVALRETAAKHKAGSVQQQLTALRALWPELRRKLQQQLIPFAEVKQRLRDAQAPTEPEQIGISRERLRRSFWEAYCIRQRFTVLDLAARAGVLDECIADIFGPRGPWPIPAK